MQIYNIPILGKNSIILNTTCILYRIFFAHLLAFLSNRECLSNKHKNIIFYSTVSSEYFFFVAAISTQNIKQQRRIQIHIMTKQL